MAAVAPAPAPVAEETGFFNSPTAKTLLRSALIYFAITFALGPNSPFKSKTDAGLITPPAATPGSTEVTGAGTPAPLAAPAVPLEALPFWAPESILDVFITLSTSVDGVVDFQDDSLPSVEWKDVPYASGKWSRDWETVIDVPLDVQHNASLWADVFVTLAGLSPNPASAAFGGDVLHVRKALTRYPPKKKIRAVKNLMSGSKAGSDASETADEPVVEDPDAPKEVMPIISYFHPNVSLEMVPASGPLPWGTFPQPLQDLVKLAHDGELNAEGKASYFPILWANDFWLMREHMNPVNETTPRLPLRITLHSSSFFKWQIMASLDDSFSKQAATSGSGGGEMDEFKRILTDTSPLLLVTTVVVTILHMLFEFLAFTSDVSHWKNKKELVGVSVRTILTNCFVQLIILLYLVDQNAETSWMILGGQGIGLAIEAWKITKAVDIKVILSVGTIIPYKLEITDKHVLTEDELKTQEYDKLAFKYVSWGTIPTLAAYTIYSMYYNEHRSWYSFVISTLTSFVYAFGFIQLIPQLIINYKLKSVAHIPIKTLTYKFLNTIVDDFFSFVIKMPFLHRLACFRDDLVFVILLYQMYIYKVDPTRANEYGQLLTEEEAAALLAANKQAEIDGVPAEEGKEKKDPKAKKVDPKTESKKNR